VPDDIACSLAGADAGAQVEEWHRLLAHPSLEVGRTSPTVLAIRWDGGPDQLHRLDQFEAVVQLARREKACCPFFGFTFEVGVDGVTMRIEVADDAVPALDTLAGPRYPADTGPGSILTS
jgi:hypothetical protein